MVHIADGDTITVLRDGEDVWIRLYGIDTPESDQPFSSRAERFTEKTIGDNRVEIVPKDLFRGEGEKGKVCLLRKWQFVNSDRFFRYSNHCPLIYRRFNFWPYPPYKQSHIRTFEAFYPYPVKTDGDSAFVTAINA